MKCSEVMTRDPSCCAPDDTAARVAKIMKTQDVGSIPVCEGHDTRKLVGIVTDRDLAIQIVAEGRDSKTVKARDVMTGHPVTCRPDDDVEAAMEAMETHQIRRIPVVDKDGRLAGIIAQADIATRTGRREKTGEVVEEVSKPAVRAA